MDRERLATSEREALDEFLAMTVDDVAERASAFAAADDPLGLGHAQAAERGRKLERDMRVGRRRRVADMAEFEQDWWIKRLSALSRTFSRPDPSAPQVEEPAAGMPYGIGERTVRVRDL